MRYDDGACFCVPKQLGEAPDDDARGCRTATFKRLAPNVDVEGFQAHLRSEATFSGLDPERRQSVMRSEALRESRAPLRMVVALKVRAAKRGGRLAHATSPTRDQVLT